MAAKHRAYRGKYPHRFREVWTQKIDGNTYAFVKDNDGYTSICDTILLSRKLPHLGTEAKDYPLGAINIVAGPGQLFSDADVHANIRKEIAKQVRVFIAGLFDPLAKAPEGAKRVPAVVDTRADRIDPSTAGRLAWALDKLDECGKQIPFTRGMVHAIADCREFLEEDAKAEALEKKAMADKRVLADIHAGIIVQQRELLREVWPMITYADAQSGCQAYSQTRTKVYETLRRWGYTIADIGRF